ncbi:Fe-S cluster assembly protein NifU [Reinekea marinisedimentorum]|uniref:Nitrogen fixation protein NifU n=1 Tax=Reinekea marinisedimentorum TaxID=230495 RepID=A0A4R3I292_9GAMM|nr:Fe-S cluster assembly protein NifU [Reinekea marinisedimentorum]TCS38861.1 NifU-like protein [Reinekea marinisedimentorum]
MWNYSEKVKDHFFAPRNAKAVEDANATGDVGSLSCGDALRLTLKVNEETEIIEEAGFQTFGCGSAIASSSALTEMIIGKTISEAQNLTNQQIADYLDGLPPEKMHCSVMGMEALHAAIANYRGEEVAEDHDEGELICRCYAIDSELIKRVVLQNNLTSLGDVIRYTKAGGACGACHEKIEWALEDILKAEGKTLGGIPAKLPVPETKPETATPAPAAASTKLTTVQRIKKIEAVLDEVRPGIQADGGDIQLNDVEDDMVFVSLTGACNGCGLAGATIAMVEERIADALGENITVYPVAGSSAMGGAA